MEIEKIIRDKIREILEIENADKMAMAEDLKEYGMDSLNAIELIVALEMEFAIEFNEEDLLVDNLCTIQKLKDVVKKYLEN
jgi:acyl carrier protein